MARIGNWELVVDEDRLVWSDETLRIFGATRSELGDDFASLAAFVHPEDLPLVRQSHDRALEAVEPFDIEYRIVRRDGAVRRIHQRAERRPGNTGSAPRMWGTIRDVTDDIPAAPDFPEWQSLARMASRLGGVGAWALDLATNMVAWSGEVCRIHDVEYGHSPSLAEALSYYTPADRDSVRSALDTCARDGRAFDIEGEILTGAKRRVWVRLVGEAERDAGGNVRRLHGALQDITQRRHTEATLRDSVAALREAQRIARIGSWELRVEEDVVLWSAELYEIFGLKRADVSPTFQAFLAVVHPDDRGDVRGWRARMLAGGAPEEIHYRIVRPDGGVRWIRKRAELLASDGVLPTRLVGMSQDITEQYLVMVAEQQAAQEIERLNRLYAALNQVHQAMIRISTRDALLKEVCSVLVGQAGFLMAWIGWHDTDTHRIEPVAACPDSPDYLSQVNVYADDRPEGRGLIGSALRDRRPHVSNELLRDPIAQPWNELFRRHGFRAAAVFPIYEAQQPRGVLVVYAGRTNVFEREEVALLEAAASDLSFALDNQARARELETQRSRLAEAEALAHIGSWETDFVTFSVRWSDESFRIFEKDPQCFVPSHQAFLDCVHPEDRDLVDRALKKSDSESTNYEIEFRLALPEGRVKEVLSRWKIVSDTTGVPVRAIGSCQDITERKKAERALRDAAEQNRLLASGLTTTLESITDAFYTLDRDWRFTYVNHEAERLLRRGRHELLGRRIDEEFPGVLETTFGTQFQRAVKQNVAIREENFYTPLGRWFEVRGFPSSQGLAVYFQDVTDRRHAREQLRALAMRLESVQELERAAIAREVHDELGQALTVLRMDASRLARMVSFDPPAAALVTEMTAAIDGTLKDARSIAMALHPTALDDLGLAPAIEMHVRQVARRADLEINLELSSAAAPLDRAQAGAVYRVLQESLTNVVRHAGATCIAVRLTECGSDVVLEVIDNGTGFDPAGNMDGARSLGVLGMRERAAAFGGRLEIEATHPHGTTVRLRLPVSGRT